VAEKEVLDEEKGVENSKDYLLRVLGVAESFGKTRYVDNVSFGISGGEILVLLGPNAAGKLTIVNTIRGEPAPGKWEKYAARDRYGEAGEAGTEVYWVYFFLLRECALTVFLLGEQPPSPPPRRTDLLNRHLLEMLFVKNPPVTQSPVPCLPFSCEPGSAPYTNSTPSTRPFTPSNNPLNGRSLPPRVSRCNLEQADFGVGEYQQLEDEVGWCVPRPSCAENGTGKRKGGDGGC
jgi:hypothetical protein